MRVAGLAGRIAPRWGWVGASRRHCEERKRRSNPSIPAPRHGLLRFARNDALIPARWLIRPAGLKLGLRIHGGPGVTLMPHFKLLLAAAASLSLSSLAIAQPAPAPARPAAVQPRPPAPAPGQQPAAAAPRSPRAAACHNGMSFDRFLADLKQQAVAEGVVAARAGRGRTLPRLRPKHRQPRPRPARIRPGVHRIRTKQGVRWCGKKCAGESPDACGSVQPRREGIWRAARRDRRVLGPGEQFWRRAGQAAYAAVAGVAGRTTAAARRCSRRKPSPP